MNTQRKICTPLTVMFLGFFTTKQALNIKLFSWIVGLMGMLKPECLVHVHLCEWKLKYHIRLFGARKNPEKHEN